MSYIIDNSIKAKHYGSKRNIDKIKYIAIHYTANSGTKASAKGNANYFKTITRKASAHYIVDTKDIIYQCVPDNYVAYAVGGSKYNDISETGGASLYGIVTNTNSISIEMVSCSNDNGFYIPKETIDRTIELIKDLMEKYPNIQGVCRHFDVTGKPCPKTHCITPEGEKQWKEFLNKINNNEKEDEPMTKEERQEFDNLKKQVADLVQILETSDKVYHYTMEVPNWGRPTIQKLLDKGLYNGTSPSDLNLPETLLRVLVINDRAGLYN